MIITKSNWLYPNLHDTSKVIRLTFSSEEIEKFLSCYQKTYLHSLLKTPVNIMRNLKVGILDNGGNYTFEYLFSWVSYNERALMVELNSTSKKLFSLNYTGQDRVLLDNETLMGLSGYYTKRTYELLSYLSQTHNQIRFPIQQLQYMFGVLGEGGSVLSPSLESPEVFIRKIIDSSISILASYPSVRHRLNIGTSEVGTYGYELYKSVDGQLFLKFLVKLKPSSFSQSRFLSNHRRIKQILKQNIKTDPENVKIPINQLKELIKLCDYVSEESADSYALVHPILRKSVNSLSSCKVPRRQTCDTTYQTYSSLIDMALERWKIRTI
nr:RepB family plasmid replication initiator protein [Vibrio sp. SCSIO 43135]